LGPGRSLRQDGQLVASELGQSERQLVRRLQVPASNLGRRNFLQNVADEEAKLSLRNRKREDAGVLRGQALGNGRVVRPGADVIKLFLFVIYRFL
jgi:hypothetical protein